MIGRHDRSQSEPNPSFNEIEQRIEKGHFVKVQDVFWYLSDVYHKNQRLIPCAVLYHCSFMGVSWEPAHKTL